LRGLWLHKPFSSDLSMRPSLRLTVGVQIVHHQKYSPR